MDTLALLQTLYKFRRNVFQVCHTCGKEDVSFGDETDEFLFYCIECYADKKKKHENTNIRRMIEYPGCAICDHMDSYGEYLSGVYNRVCKKCFVYKLEEFMNPSCNIKPAKQ